MSTIRELHNRCVFVNSFSLYNSLLAVDLLLNVTWFCFVTMFSTVDELGIDRSTIAGELQLFLDKLGETSYQITDILYYLCC